MTPAQIEKVIIDVAYDPAFIQALATAISKQFPQPPPTQAQIEAAIASVVGKQPTVYVLSLLIYGALEAGAAPYSA